MKEKRAINRNFLFSWDKVCASIGQREWVLPAAIFPSDQTLLVRNRHATAFVTIVIARRLDLASDI
jgi:hypothetical protein